MDLNTFKQNVQEQGQDDGIIVNPNIARTAPVSEMKEIDPTKLDSVVNDIPEQEHNDFEQVIGNANKYVQDIISKGNEYKDVMEQSEVDPENPNLTGDIIEQVEGFDPIALMSNTSKISTKVEFKDDESNENNNMKEDKNIMKSTEPITNNTDNEINEPDENVEEATEAANTTISEDEEDILNDIECSTAEEPVIKEVKKETKMRSKDDSANDTDPLVDFEDEIEKELDDSEAESNDQISQERLDELKKQINDKISPIIRPYNLSSFTISSKPASVRNTTSNAKHQHTKVADWALYHTRQHITMEGFMGEDINTIIGQSRRNTVSTIRERYQVFYDHILDEDKPKSLDEWLKVTSAKDVPHLYAAAYRASFEGINFIAYDCDNPKCKNAFISNSVPFMDMVKFKDSKVKADFMSILNREAQAGDLYVGAVTQISPSYAVVIKDASIYDAAIKISYLDDEFKTKYSNAVGFSPYIDSVYYINTETQTLDPIKFMYYSNNVGKTEKAKIIVLSKVIKTLTPDELNLLTSLISKFAPGSDDPITYRTPEVVCPKCGKKIDEEQSSMVEMLFLRHQLAALANG